MADEVVVRLGRRRTPTSTSSVEYREVDALSYEIDLDMLELADTWSVRLRFESWIWDWAITDAPILIELNGRPICSGFVDDRKRRRDKNGSFIDLNGRDKGGRLVDSAAPMINFTGIGILDLARKMVTAIGGFPLFPDVSLQNAVNRKLMGGGRRARVSGEPAIRPTADRNDRRVHAGQTRSQVLEDWLEEAGLLGWSSADGNQFIVGKPNHAQEPQFSLFVPRQLSDRMSDGNVIEIDHAESSGERYSRIIVLGTGAGNAKNYGENVHRRGVALQGPNGDGTGGHFGFPKDLILVDDNLHSQAAAKARAAREMALRESTAVNVTAVVRGHSQESGPDRKRSNYTPDVIVRLEDEEILGPGRPIDFLITRCQYSGSKMGRTTRLTMVPKGTDLRMTSG